MALSKLSSAGGDYVRLAEQSGLAPKDLFHLLATGEALNVFELTFELACPDCHSTVDYLDGADTVPQYAVECEICGFKFRPTASSVWMYYTLPGKLAVSVPVPLPDAADYSARLDAEYFRVDRQVISRLLRSVLTAKGNTEKKNSLEGLARHLFEGIKGFTCIGPRRTATSEIDQVFRNDADPRHPFLYKLGGHLAIECKNWSKPVGSDAIRDFAGKLKVGEVGVMLSRNGITGKGIRDGKGEICKQHGEGKIVLVLNAADIERIIAGENLIAMMRLSYESTKYA